jgi:putative Ca2+/H+ antiporter (TMEM165/GDT1 family)
LLAFFTTLLAELGDKTQLVTLMLASRYPPRQVLAGALGALAAITLLAVLLGDLLAELLPAEITLPASGIFFLAMGAWLLLRAKKPENQVHKPPGAIVLHTFLFVFFAELGDKTQLTAVALSAATGAPLSVFLGAMGGQLVNHGAAAYLGSRFLGRLPVGAVQLVSAVLFLLFGLLFLFLAFRSPEALKQLHLLCDATA